MWPAVGVPEGAIVVPHGVVVWVAMILWLVSLLLAWPVPVWFSRAGWPMRAPVIALLLWQGV
ncbi:MAG: hypothetical protein ACTHZV_02845, partial [Agrococcus casei]